MIILPCVPFLLSGSYLTYVFLLILVGGFIIRLFRR